MLDKLKNLFKKPEPVKTEHKVQKSKVEKTKEPVKLTPKEEATKNGEPYIDIVKVELDPNNINNGAFELDWNDKFVLNLVRAGYKIKADDKDSDIVDRWFQTVCRNVALEVYEQEQADPSKRDDIRVVRSRDIGNGRTEVS